MVDIQRMRELLASFPETFNKAHSMGGPTDWSARASLEYHYSEAMASLPALLDELERLKELIRKYRDEVCTCSQEVHGEIIDGKFVEAGVLICEACEEADKLLGASK